MQAATADRLLRFVVILTMLSLAIDAGGQIGVRLVLPLGFLLIVLLKRKLVAFPHALLLFGLMVAYPTCLYIVGLMRNADVDVAVSQYRSTVLSWAMFIALAGINYTFLARALYSSLAATALLATILAMGLVIGIPGLEGYLASLAEQAAGYFGKRGVADSYVPNVQFKSTLFFVPAAIYFLVSKRFIPFYICVIGLVVAVSKAGIAFVLGAACVYFLTSKGYKRWLGIASVVIIVVLLYDSPMWELFAEIERGESRTLEIRLLHYESLFKLFAGDHIGLIFGFGLGTGFYSEGAGFFVTNIELDHLNVIRKYGLVWSIVFFGFVTYIVARAIRSAAPMVRTLGACLGAAFIVAGTNPVLISPVFFLILFITMQALNQGRVVPDTSSRSVALVPSGPKVI